MITNGCPRCKGALYLDYDRVAGEHDVVCILCGYRRGLVREPTKELVREPQFATKQRRKRVNQYL